MKQSVEKGLINRTSTYVLNVQKQKKNTTPQKERGFGGMIKKYNQCQQIRTNHVNITENILIVIRKRSTMVNHGNQSHEYETILYYFSRFLGNDKIKSK